VCGWNPVQLQVRIFVVIANRKKRFLALSVSLAMCLSIETVASGFQLGPTVSDIGKVYKQLDAARKKGDKAETASLLYTLGDLESQKGNPQKAEELLRESLKIDEEIGAGTEKVAGGKFIPAVHTRIALATILIKLGRSEEALKLYEEAAAKAEKLNLEDEAITINKQLGSVYLNAREFNKAQDCLNKAKAAAEKGGHKDILMSVLAEMSALARYRKNFELSVEYLKQAVALIDDTTDELDEGRILTELGRTYADMGLPEKAVEYYEKSSKVYASGGDRVAEAEVLISMAELDLSERKPDAALARLKTALAALEGEDAAKILARCYTRLGSAQADTGSMEEAVKSHKAAEKLASKCKSEEEECLAITEQGYDYLLEGKSEKALGEFLRAQKYIEKHPNLRQSERADVLKYCAMGYRNVGQPKTAIRYYLEAAQLYKKSGKALDEALALDSIAVAYLDQGSSALFEKYHDQAKSVFQAAVGKVATKSDKRAQATMAYNYGQYCVMKSMYADAIEAYEQSLNIAKSINDSIGHCQALRGLGMTYLLLGQTQKSRDNYEAAAAIAEKVANIESQWDCAAGLGKVYMKLGEQQNAEKMLLKAVSLADKERGNLSRDSFKTAALDLREDCFFDLVELMINSKRYDQALEYAEKGRARAFLDMLEGRKQTSYAQRRVAMGTPDLLDEAGLTPAAPAEEKPVQIAMATVPAGTFRGVQVSPKTTTTVVEATVLSSANAKPPSLAEIKQLIKGCNSWVVEYLAMPEKVIVFVIKPDGEIADVKVITEKIENVKNLIRDTHKNITTAPKGMDEVHSLNTKRQQSLRALHKMLVEPIEPLLPKDENQVITIVPHGSLFSVPFAALVAANGKYMIEEHTLAYLPAIGVLRATQSVENQTKGEKNSLLAFGNPITEMNKFLGKLPYAEKEVKKVSSLFEPTSVAVEVGGAATKTKFRELAPKYSYIHLATHGLVNQEQPMDSAVVLAPESGDDGLLTVKDILQLPQLRAKMIVLSACQTGQGKITGDGVVGLSRAFVIAGTPSVLVSLWSVDDVMTEFQMESLYYELLRGANKAQSLRKAQIKTINFLEKGLSSRDEKTKAPVKPEDRANPRYWAAFQLLGEYN
jgi:CHAT domain-containing protein/tetratricopeptide (TPR) repeat protein